MRAVKRGKESDRTLGEEIPVGKSRSDAHQNKTCCSRDDPSLPFAANESSILLTWMHSLLSGCDYEARTDASPRTSILELSSQKDITFEEVLMQQY